MDPLHVLVKYVDKPQKLPSKRRRERIVEDLAKETSMFDVSQPLLVPERSVVLMPKAK